MKHSKLLAILTTVLLLLGACGQAADTSASATMEPSPAAAAATPPAATPSPTQIPTTPPDVTQSSAQPSATPDDTAAPTATPKPSATPAKESQPSAPPVNNASGTPLSGLVIGIDPGHQAHSNSDPEPVAPGSSETKKKVSSGTQGRDTGVAEYKVNLQVGLKLKKLLTGLGATVVMTRESHDVDISNKARAEMMNDAGADLVIRIHCNGSNDESKHGAFVLIPSNDCTAPINDASKKAGRCIVDAFCAATGAKNLGLQPRSDQTGFNWSTVPVCNIEMGHMTNKDEDNLLVSDDYQNLCAQGIANGIADYFS